MSIPLDTASTRFAQAYGSSPEIVVRAPGRVNLIGEHTDYNMGFVLPMAIGRDTLIAARPRQDRRLHAIAGNLSATHEADLAQPQRQLDAPWLDYLLGVAAMLHEDGYSTPGADILILGDVPLGCGLSSSAALEMAALSLFEALGNYTLDPRAAPLLGQRVENDFLGLRSGIMDQFISRNGSQDHAIFLDCRSLSFELVPIAMADTVFVIANTGVSRGLTSSKYNERVAECHAAVEGLNRALGGRHTHLRDFSLQELEAGRDALDPTVFRRARHVITENARTESACDALRRGDRDSLGCMMDASDASLHRDYEVTCPELQAMTRIARNMPGCYGARMTGAGFGGCTVNLVNAAHAEDWAKRLLERYSKETGLRGETIVTGAAAGASRLR